jgi:CRP-like cAMP-binding protein
VSTNDHLTRKLEHFTQLSPAEKDALEKLMGERVRRIAAREDLLREGSKAEYVCLILSGWACRYRTLEDGRRQITAFLVPGDLSDPDESILRAMDHSIGALTRVTCADISREAIERVTGAHPRLSKALRWERLVTAAIQREWTVSLGQRSAFERVAHLLCELFLRLHAVGLVEANRCELPPTQAELAEATGLSAVQVNRTLQELRRQGLILLRGRELAIPNLKALQSAAQFNPNYLHRDHEGLAA